MLDAKDYLSLVDHRSRNGQPLHRVYRGIRNPSLYHMAYMNLYGNKGAMTPGVNPDDTVDGMSLERVDTIISKLSEGTYNWTPSRRVYIPKANGDKRPLSLPGWRDKMVQEVIRLVLDAYYEPGFSTHSHGFRPNRSCHTALGEIVRTWKGVKWIIEGDIKGCFDNINHNILLDILGRDLHDKRFLGFIRGMLETGYIDDWRYNCNFSGTPQGGVISPLLANVYLNELDQFIEKTLVPKWNKGIPNKRPPNKKYYQKYQRAYYFRKKGETQELTDDEVVLMKRLFKEAQLLPVYAPQDNYYRRLRYVRYADDFVLGFIGSKAEAEEVKEEIKCFLKERLDLNMSEEKTLITHASTERARFLGYHIHMPVVNSKRNKRRRSINYHPQLTVPPDVLHKWKRKYSKKGKTVHKPELLENSDFDIIRTFESQLRGAVNYYAMAHNVCRWNSVQWVMEQSLVKTLAAKLKTTAKKIYRKYVYKPNDGKKGLRVVVKREEKKPLVSTFGTKPIKRVRLGYVDARDDIPRPFNANRSELLQRLLADKCELCGNKQGPFEVHHIRKLSDLKRCGKNPPQWVETMSALRRKSLVVCKDCHLDIHAGRYDGKRL